MTVMTALILLTTGLFAGAASGLFGIGGGLIIVPALLIGLQLPSQTAVAVSLVALLIPVGVSISVYNYYSHGRLEQKHFIYGILICIGMIVGSFISSRFALTLSEKTLRRCFSVFLIVMAAIIWLRNET
jgi:uncharacterized membrane protein YfcA